MDSFRDRQTGYRCRQLRWDRRPADLIPPRRRDIRT